MFHNIIRWPGPRWLPVSYQEERNNAILTHRETATVSLGLRPPAECGRCTKPVGASPSGGSLATHRFTCADGSGSVGAIFHVNEDVRLAPLHGGPRVIEAAVDRRQTTCSVKRPSRSRTT